MQCRCLKKKCIQDDHHVFFAVRIKFFYYRGWVCVPLVVEVFGGWGSEAQEALSRVAKELAIRTSHFWPELLASIYCRLGITLMCQNARALLGRTTGEVDISSVYM